jgi:tetratricopeptide (TPR) repeat protein
MPTSGHSAAAKDDGGAQPVPVPSATATAATAAPPAEKPPATGGAEPQVDMLGLAQSPVEAQLLKKIDALYAELKLEEVKDVLDDALRDESDLATIVQLLQFRASVLFGLGNVQESMDEYSHCTQLVQQAEAVPDDTAEQVNQFWAIKAALNLELGNKDEAEDCLEEAESNGMLRAEAESLGNEIVNGYKEGAYPLPSLLLLAPPRLGGTVADVLQCSRALRPDTLATVQTQCTSKPSSRQALCRRSFRSR